MKITEILLEETENKMPHLFLDMDGVQADFFGAWSKRSGVNHWKAIADKEAEINQLAHSSAKDVYDFFYNLQPLSGGMKVISWLRNNQIPYTVLSAPLRGPSYSNSNLWLKRHEHEVLSESTQRSAGAVPCSRRPGVRRIPWFRFR